MPPDTLEVFEASRLATDPTEPPDFLPKNVGKYGSPFALRKFTDRKSVV